MKNVNFGSRFICANCVIFIPYITKQKSHSYRTITHIVKFLLNKEVQNAQLPSGTVVLDYLRYYMHLTGSKAGCREGDCGTCMILLGHWNKKARSYRAINSCLLPLGEVESKHVVTIEGLNRNSLNPIQQAIVDQGATQCGYCTPGLVIALTAFFVGHSQADDLDEALAAVGGNICRCTGYVSFKRVIEHLYNRFDLRKLATTDRFKQLVEWQILPDYFLHVPNRLEKLAVRKSEVFVGASSATTLVAGGTDLFVQKADTLREAELEFLSRRKLLSGIRISQNNCNIGAMTSVEEIRSSPIMRHYFPRIAEDFKLICSAPVRNRATIGGNIINASPIGDLIIFFLALDTSVTLNDGQQCRELKLKDLFKGYKQLDIAPHELLESIYFELPKKPACFNFEKVSKRTYLDIASVNSAMYINVDQGVIQQIHLSAGGIAPIPLYLTTTAEYLRGRELKGEHVCQATEIAQTEISPQADVRGSVEYKRLLLRQLIFVNFLSLFPAQITWESLQ